MMSGFGRAALIGAGVAAAALGVAAGAGAIYEAVSERRDRRLYPPPGELVEIGVGYRLHLIRAGQGGPTVILDAGLAGFTLDWGLVTPEIARFTTVCAYDRAGYGWSDPGPQPRTSVALARELRALLDRADVPGPYVLVGHSFAGYTLRIFADNYPDDVAGMVLVDASQEELPFRLARRELRNLLIVDQIAKVVLWAGELLARIGLVRLAGERGLLAPLHPFTRLPPRERAEAFAWRYLPRFYRTSLQEYVDFPVSGEQARHTGSLGDKPVIALSAIGSDGNPATTVPSVTTATGGATPTVASPTVAPRPNRRRAEVEALLVKMSQLGAQLQGEVAARLSTRSQHIVTDQSGHQIAITQPQLVIDAIRQVVEAVRAEQQVSAPNINSDVR